MAVDEVLLETAATRGLATLRFYAWDEPTLSLGYFQAAAECKEHPASLACPLVRRSSGGGAIVHDQELTYSLAWPRQEAPVRSASALYSALHEALVETLAELGVPASLFVPCADLETEQAKEPFLCFQRLTCGDVVCGGAKIAGSAQRRRQGAVLQHGSVLLRSSRCAPTLPGIAELTGKSLTAHELATPWRVRALDRLKAIYSEATLNAAEHQRVKQLQAERFESDRFIFRR